MPDVNEYLLERIIRCPFCKGDKLLKEPFHEGFYFKCGDCGFQFSTYDLYQRVLEAGVKKGTEAFGNVLIEAIDEEVKEYEKELEGNIVKAVLLLDKLKERLRRHKDRLFEKYTK
jgi:hypothetical protein